MKSYLAIVAMTLICGWLPLAAQSRGDNLQREADSALEQKEYVKARYHYLKAYEAFAKEQNADKAVPAAVNVSALYHRENYYKEAFETLMGAEAVLSAAETEQGKQRPGLHYPIARERHRMYMKLKNVEKAREQLAKMRQWAQDEKNPETDKDLLTTEANFYYTFGQPDKGDQAVNQLIALYLNDNNYDKADECYKTIIQTATRTNNARMLARSYEKYLAWSDSIGKVRAAAEYAKLNADYEAAKQTIEERDSSLTAKTAIIVGLIALATLLAVALVMLGISLVRYIATTKRQKKAINTAKANNEMKSRFIANISSQMAPTLDTLPQNLPAVKALKGFAEHIQTLSDQENAIDQPLPTEDVNVADFCQEAAARVEPLLRPEVTLSVNAPKMSARINQEALAGIIDHLLANAAEYTPAGGKITLDFKKRGPHNIQFIVTDSGPGIAPEARADIFKPFAQVRDLTGGDGLGLPICAVTAARMNGTVRLDEEYAHGARFIVELHP